MFNENSGLVKIWVRLLTQNNTNYTINSIPDIGNLKEIILSCLNKK